MKTQTPQPANIQWGQEQSCPLHVFLRFRSKTLQSITLKEAPSFGLFCIGDAPDIKAVAEWFQAFLKGKHLPFPLPLGAKLGSFTWKVLNYLSKIPVGKTMSYQEIAIALGNPNAARAVGNACNRNPFPLIIPCHRVIQTGGGLGGFAYGCEMKQMLLNLEQQLTQ